LKHLCYIIFKRIGYIHTFCTPAGGYGYILSKITGRKLVVDSYEPHAEYMVECGVWKESEFAFKVLNSLEKKQALRAKHLIATTPTMVPHTNQRFQINIRDWEVKPACVDLEKFSYDGKTAGEMRSQLGLHNKIVCVYAGKFGDFYLKEEVFEFYKVAFEYWKEKFHVLLLSDISRDELDEYCNRFQLPPQGFTLIKAPHSLVPKYMSAADFGLSPYRPTPSKRFCTPIKNGEYWALGLPVVITKDISVDSDMISEKGIGYVLNDLTPNEYLNAVKKIDELLKKERDQLRKQIRQVAVDNRSFSIAESIYQKIYN
jgi:glycosyltransferase involved in cell wall biosynthesis